MSKPEQFDLAVLGAGPGGYVAAIHAAQVGLKVAIIEKDSRLGGTCLLRGCIPTKALLHAADVYEECQHGDPFGVIAKEVSLDFAKTMAYKAKTVTVNAKGVEFLMRKHKISVLNGFGRLEGKGKISITSEKDGTREIQVKNTIVATGSTVRRIPTIPIDGKKIITSDELLELQELPKSMIVLGAGAVGVEFASIFQRFGVECTIVEMMPRILPVEDEEISKELEKALKKQGIKIHTSTKLENVAATATGVVADAVTESGTTKVEAAMLLVAIGRAPVSDGIGLENIKARVDRGYIQVDKYLQTDEPGVYAIGDVVPTPWLAHVASHEGIVAVDHMAGRHPHAINYDFGVPGVTFCAPEVGSIGLTEKKAIERGYDVKVGRFPWTANGKAKILNKAQGLVKVVTDAKYGEILGIHILGPAATELVAIGGMAIAHEATAESVFNTIHAHPTLSEAVMEAAADAIGMVIHY